MNKSFIIIGKIVSTQGNKGEVKVVPLTNSIDRFRKLTDIFIKKGNNKKLLNINNLKIKKNTVILKFEGIENIEKAEMIVGSFLEVKRSNAIKLPKDTYFIFDIIGLEVYTNENELLGKVENIISTGSNDVYVVKNKDKQEILIPAIREVIKNIDLEKKRISINMVDGLI
ncbi:MAG: 16S rRNA processing protein RimM [Candidatus Atribacteria bacterium]